MSNVARERKGAMVSLKVHTWDTEMANTEEMKTMNRKVVSEFCSLYFRSNVISCSQKATKRLTQLTKDVDDLKSKLLERGASIPLYSLDKIKMKELNFPYRCGNSERIFYCLLMLNIDLSQFSFQQITDKLKVFSEDNKCHLLHESAKMLYSHRVSYTNYCNNYSEIQKKKKEKEFLLAYQNDLNSEKTDVVLAEPQVNEESNNGNSIDQVSEEVVTLSSTSAKASNQNVTKAFFAIFIVLMAIFYNYLA